MNERSTPIKSTMSDFIDMVEIMNSIEQSSKEMGYLLSKRQIKHIAQKVGEDEELNNLVQKCIKCGIIETFLL